MSKGKLLVIKYGDRMLQKILRITLLYDFYGALLTEKQRQCIEMHYLNDLSLAEIAEYFQVSRQAIYDILKRAVDILENYEQKLCLVERFENSRIILQQVSELLESYSCNESVNSEELDKARNKLKQLLE